MEAVKLTWRAIRYTNVSKTYRGQGMKKVDDTWTK